MHDTIQPYVDRFLEFVSRTPVETEEDQRNIGIKREHSLFVLDNARMITASLDLEPEFLRLCLIAALLHDIGRFPQYRLYRTFLDVKSEDHGILGAKTLRREAMVQDMPLPARRLVQGTVILHNRRFLPEAIPQPLRLMTQVIRDADKLDIIRVMLLHFGPDARNNPVVTLHVQDHPTAYNKDVYDSIMQGQRADYRQLQYVNDFKLMLCGWTQDLYFAASRKAFRERGLLEGLLENLPDLPEMRALADRLRAFLDQSD